MNLAELLQPWVSVSDLTCELSGLKQDSRIIKPGDLFIAFRGAKTDGRNFMTQAQAAGAAAIVYDPLDLPASCVLPQGIPTIAIQQLATHLAELASRFYRYPTRALRVTGVTGTNGKTTIAYQLASAYGLLGISAAYMGTLGQGEVDALQALPNTTPDPLVIQALFCQYQHRGIQQVCMEVSSHGLSQNRVGCVDFTQAIFTNLTHDHLDYHRTISDYAAAKAKLFAVPSLQTAIMNQDDPFFETMKSACNRGCAIITYGFAENCDVRAYNPEITATGSRFEVDSPWGTYFLQTKTVGKFNIYNSLAVFISLMSQGFMADEVISVVSRLHSSPGRMEIVLQKPCVIVDYAHTPDALKNVVSTLNALKQARLIVVMGCGGDRDKEKRPIMGKIASDYADLVIITSDNPRHEAPEAIIEQIVNGLDSRSSYHAILDRKEAIQFALQSANPQDIVLIAGKGHESYQEIGDVRIAFSDQEVVSQFDFNRV